MVSGLLGWGRELGGGVESVCSETERERCNAYIPRSAYILLILLLCNLHNLDDINSCAVGTKRSTIVLDVAHEFYSPTVEFKVIVLQTPNRCFEVMICLLTRGLARLDSTIDGLIAFF